MKRKAFNRIICLLTTITMLSTPFASLADDLPPQDSGIEMVENEDSGSGEDDTELQTDIVNESDRSEEEELILGEDTDEDDNSPVLDMDDQSLGVAEPFHLGFARHDPQGHAIPDLPLRQGRDVVGI